MAKLNTKEFIQKAKEIHGDKYDYSLVDYKTNKDKVKIICKEHGVFEQTPTTHIYKKSGCYKCAINTSAEKCKIKLVDNKQSNEFLISNHLQGKCNSSIKIGLFYNNDLVSIMTFGKARYSDADWELIRFCNKINISVVGGHQSC